MKKGNHGRKKTLRRTVRVARIIALMWSCWWVFFGLASGVTERLDLVGIVRYGTFPGLLFLITAFLAWQWEFSGGLLLFSEGLFLLFYYPMHFAHLPVLVMLSTLAILAVPPLTAGMLFLTYWSKRSLF